MRFLSFFLLLLALLLAINCNQSQKGKEAKKEGIVASQFRSIVRKQIRSIQTLSAEEFQKVLQNIEGLIDKNQESIAKMMDKFQQQTKVKQKQLDFEFKKLQTQVRQNHQAIIDLALAFIATRISYFESLIDSVEQEMKKILEQIEPPVTSCTLLSQCEQCLSITTHNCVWCDREDKCVSGGDYGSDFFECTDTWLFYEEDLFTSNQTDPKNKQSDAEKALQLCQTDRVQQKLSKNKIEQSYLLNKRVDVRERAWVEEKQQQLIELSWQRTQKRKSIEKLTKFFYNIKLKEIQRFFEFENPSINQSFVDSENRFTEENSAGYINSLPDLTDEERFEIEEEYQEMLAENTKGKGGGAKNEDQPPSDNVFGGENNAQDMDVQDDGEDISLSDDQTYVQAPSEEGQKISSESPGADQQQIQQEEGQLNEDGTQKEYTKEQKEEEQPSIEEALNAANQQETPMQKAQRQQKTDKMIGRHKENKEVKLDLDSIENDEQEILDYIAQDLEREEEEEAKKKKK